MIKRLALLAILLITSVVVSCGQTDETHKLIDEMNANRTKCQELTKQAEAKRSIINDAILNAAKLIVCLRA